MGAIQQRVLRNMSTGTYDLKGLSVVTNHPLATRVVKSLVTQGFIQSHQSGEHTLYQRSKKGQTKIYNIDKWNRRKDEPRN